jgi:hypothetical protein
MGRLRLISATATTAAVTAVAVAVAGPATAAVATTRTQVVRSLLTATQVGQGWHKYDGGGSTSPEVEGCLAGDASPRGLRFTAGREYQYLTTPAFGGETVYAFGTARSARRDFNASVRLLDSCSSFTLDGDTWTVARMSAPEIADQTVRYRLKGSVTTAAGKVPLVMFLVVSRYGRQEVAASLAAGGALTSAQRTEFAKASVRLCRLATAKVAARLGR